MVLEERPVVAVIYTGGTIGMMHNAAGALEPAKGYLRDQMGEMSEMNDPRMPRYTFMEYTPLLDSSDMDPSDWIRIACDIEKLYPEVDGFVVIMGTDTMAYCASALSFMLQNLAKPVIITGGAVPLCEVYNDSRRNLIVSMLFACSTQLCEVCVFFNDVLLRGSRVKKVSSSGLDAFHSPNFPPLAKLSAQHFTNPRLRMDLLLDPPRGRFVVQKRMDAHVIFVKLVPGFSHTILSDVMEHTPGVRALVLETYGSGDLTTRNDELINVVEGIAQRGILVIISSQVLQGSTSIDSFELGRRLMKFGVLSGSDMTAEAILTKLSYLFGKGIDVASVRTAMALNLRGEVTAVSPKDRVFSRL